MDSDSVSPGSNPGSPAKLFQQNQLIGRLDKPDRLEQPAHIGRTKVGTVRVPTDLPPVDTRCGVA